LISSEKLIRDPENLTPKYLNILGEIKLRAENYEKKEWVDLPRAYIEGLFSNDKNFLIGPKGVGKTYSVLSYLIGLIAHLSALTYNFSVESFDRNYIRYYINSGRYNGVKSNFSIENNGYKISKYINYFYDNTSELSYFNNRDNRKILYIQYANKSKFEFYDTSKLEYWKLDEGKELYHLYDKIDKSLNFSENLEKIISSESGGILILDDIHYILDDLINNKISADELYKIISLISDFKGRKLFISNDRDLRLKQLRERYFEIYEKFSNLIDFKGNVKEVKKTLPDQLMQNIPNEDLEFIEDLNLVTRDYLAILKEMRNNKFSFDRKGIINFSITYLNDSSLEDKNDLISFMKKQLRTNWQVKDENYNKLVNIVSSILNDFSSKYEE